VQINSAFISRAGIDMLIIRENTGDCIQALKDSKMMAISITERVITRKGSERIIRKAFWI